MILLTLTLGVGNAWGGTITWNTADNSGKSDVTLTANHTFTGDDACTILTYANPNGCKRIKSSGGLYMNGASSYGNSKNQRHFTFKAPSATGTVSITFAAINGKNDGTGSTTVRIYGGTTVAYDVNTLNSSLTSPVIEGLKTGTSDVIITFLAKCTIKEIKWTDVASTTYTTVYANDFTASPMGAAAVSYSNMSAMASAVTGWTGWDNTYAKGYASSSSSCSATLTFATPLALNSDGTDCGRIRVYWGHSSNNKTLGLKVNGSSVTFSPTTVATTIYPTMLNVAEYTIPKTTTTISSIQPSGSGSTITYLFRIEVLTHASAGPTCEDAPTVSSMTKGATTATTQVVNCAGISSLGSEGCTISSYGFVYGTSANPTISDTKVQVGTTYTTTGTAFATTTLTGLTPSTTYYVRAYATNGAGTTYSSGDSFTTPASIGNVVYIAGSADATNDAIKALRDANYVVTVRTKAASPDYTGVDLVVLDESLTWGSSSDEAGTVIAADVPILNLKSFFYKSDRWNWGTPVNPSPKSELATLSTEYSNVSSHPIFDDVTISDGAVDMIGTSTEGGNNLQGVTTSTLVSGKEGYTLATSADGTTCIHELTPAQRGVINSKYLLIALSNDVKDKYSADAKKMIVNAAAYLIDNSEQWEPAVPSCAATAEAGADKSTTVGEGVAMAATAATSGYTGAWSIKAGSPSSDADQLGTTSSNTMTFTPNNTGTYTLVWTVTDDNDNTCYATSEATVTVTAPTHGISYTNLKGSDVSSYPTTYTEGVGIASFDALDDITDFHFTGWSPSSISSSATTDQTISATWVDAYDVTFDAGDGGGTVPSSFQKWEDATFTLPGQGSMTAPSGYAFDGWNDGTNDYAEGATYTMGNAAVTLTAQWDEIPTYTISLDANGGSVASYDGWTKVGDVYSKTVEEGTGVSLLAFTKADVQLMFFRDGSANEYTSSVTLNADLSLKAVWGEEKEVELYYWEGKSGGATERGGTASPMNGAEAGSDDVNYSQSTYYTLRLRGKADFSTNWIKIELDEGVAVKTGDEVKVTGYYSNSNTKQSAPLMKDGDGNTIFAETTTLPNIQQEEDPEERIYTVPANIDASVLKLTRNVDMTATNAFITKLVITGTRVIEVMDPAQAPTISAHPAGASYTWKDAVSALTVTAAVTDGGTLHYQWYKAGETDTKVGTDAASYTPEESGTYYVVVTNKKTGYSDKSTTSNNAVVTIGTRPSYTVTYYDGASSLGTESVQEDASPTNYAAKQAKAVYGIIDLYEFNGWYDNSGLTGDAVTIASAVITKDTTFYGKWTRIEASSVDLAAYASENLSGNESTDAELNTFKTWFTGQGYVYANLYKLDKTTNNNGAYSGLKTRSTDAYVAFNVPANKRVTVKLGSMAAAAEMYINGVKNESQALTGGSTSSGNNYADWYYDVNAASTFKLQMKTGSTCVVKAITIGEIPALSDDATLSDLTVGGTTVAGFAAGKLDYYVELPYGTEDAPTVAGTANDENAKSVTPTQAASLPGNATIVVVAEDDETSKTYTIHFSVAPKLGVELIKATHTGATTANKTGYWKDDATVDKNTQGGGKLGSDDHYFGLTLGSEKFMNGDLLCIYLKTTEDPSQWLQVFKDKGTNIIIDQQSAVKKGANYFTLSGLPEGGIDELYVYRTTTAKSKMNPYVDYIAVYREMDPFFESFTVAGEDATIDETVSPKTINVIVPAVTDITELTPTYKAWANGGATVSPTTAQDFSAGAIDYTVTSAYSETTTYQVTVTKAAAIKEVLISGTLTVMEDNTTTLSAAVYDTNDALAANQNVTWSVKSGDESLAEVDANGVVTGKAVGTAHIIATSMADDSKSAEVAVTVTENPCRVWNAPTSSWSDALVTVGKLQIARGDCPASNSMVPYSGAGTMYGIKIDGSGKFIELTMSDGAQFESLTLGVSSGSNGSSPKYVVVASSAKTFDADAVLSAVEYVANAKDAEQSLNVISLPTGTRNVRLYRTYDAKGDGTSVFLYYINACKKDLVALTSVAVADKSLAIGVAGIPAVTLTPANADVASYAWEIVSDETGAATINATTGAISSTAVGTVTVKVTATDVLSNVVESNICTVTIVDIVERADVTGSMTWNWNGAGTANVSVATDRGLALANYISGDAWKYISGTNGDFAYNTNNSGSYQGNGSLSFRTTVPGLVKITGKRISNNAVITINGAVTAGTLGESVATLNAICVAAGEVTITPDSKGMRITKIEFDANLVPAEAEESFLGGYERTVDPQYFGTVCLPKAGVMTGALLFQIAYMDYKEDGVTPYKVYYDEVENGTMQAGMPYIFLAEQSTIGVYYTGTTEVTAGNELDYNGLHGTLVNITEGMNGTGVYMLYNNKVLHSTNPASYLNANRAYIQISEIPGYDDPGYVAPAPSRRRIDTGFNETNTATALENLHAGDQPVKMIINGQIFILRGEKMYDVTGKLVK